MPGAAFFHLYELRGGCSNWTFEHSNGRIRLRQHGTCFIFPQKNLLWEQIFCGKDGLFPIFFGNMWLGEPHVSEKDIFFRPAGGEKNSLTEDREPPINDRSYAVSAQPGRFTR